MKKMKCKCGYKCEIRLNNFLFVCKCGRVYKEGFYAKRKSQSKYKKEC